MSKLGDVPCAGRAFQLGHQLVQVHVFDGRLTREWSFAKQPLAVDWFKQRATLFERSQTIQPNSVEPFKDVSILTVLGVVAMLVYEALNLLEPGDNPLFPW
ncbi:hypothetical protein [Sphingomonas daechungensis]|uniref:hypothetical protein n=1 Tax=Sphingomonas daechungensis TaxID=1176646 RepID=UPI00378357C9